MAITNTDEFLAYSSFNSTGGVTTADTFNTWRKKTNGIINAIDSITITNVTPSQLSLGAPTWNTSGTLSTYGSGSFTAGAINGTTITGTTITGTTINGTIAVNGGTITGTSLKVGGSAAAATGGINSLSLAVGTTNTQFTVSSTGTVIGTSLKVGGSAAAATGGINSLSLAVGTTNTQFTVSNTGAIVGTSLNVGSGAITAGAIVGTSLNVGSGAVTAGAVTAASFTGPLNGNATSATTAATATTVSNASVTAAKLDGGQSGTAPIFGARAWANFNGVGGVAIRGSGNISSITRTSVGRYTINFTVAMPDTNYAIVGMCTRAAVGDNGNAVIFETLSSTSAFSEKTVNSINISVTNSANTFQDAFSANIAIFR
jgi:hypothetical protein